MDVSVLLKLFLGCGKPQEPAILYFSCSHNEQRQLFKGNKIGQHILLPCRPAALEEHLVML